MDAIITGRGSSLRFEAALRDVNAHSFLLVKDAAFAHLPCAKNISACALPHVDFDSFTSNPRYDDVRKGVALFRENGCDAILAVGGGSSIDVAKCIKLFARMDPSACYLQQPFEDSGIPLVAIPTTAGTGSEATRFAVIYDQGEKQSIAQDGLVPDRAILDGALLDTLPVFQKKCTLLDALCQGIESWWSVRSTDESVQYSRLAVESIARHMDGYLAGEQAAADELLLASHRAGQAINLTQTTAPHAMSYKLTSLYGLPHGYAVALCLPQVWRYMLAYPQRCVDPRGSAFLSARFVQIASALGCGSPQAAIVWLEAMLARLGMLPPPQASAAELPVLAGTVNPVRLKNNPVSITAQDAETLYRAILRIA